MNNELTYQAFKDKLFVDAKVWYDSYKKATSNKDDLLNEKYKYKYDYTRNRLYNRARNLLSNHICKFDINEEILNSIIDKIDFFINHVYSNEILRKAHIKDKNQRAYAKRTNQNLSQILTRKEVGQITKQRQVAKGKDTKEKVIQVMDLITKNNEKITVKKVQAYLEEVFNKKLGLTQCKKYVKEIKLENMQGS